MPKNSYRLMSQGSAELPEGIGAESNGKRAQGRGGDRELIDLAWLAPLKLVPQRLRKGSDQRKGAEGGFGACGQLTGHVGVGPGSS